MRFLCNTQKFDVYFYKNDSSTRCGVVMKRCGGNGPTYLVYEKLNNRAIRISRNFDLCMVLSYIRIVEWSK
jgi:hypothetical protein